MTSNLDDTSFSTQFESKGASSRVPHWNRHSSQPRWQWTALASMEFGEDAEKDTLATMFILLEERTDIWIRLNEKVAEAGGHGGQR